MMIDEIIKKIANIILSNLHIYISQGAGVVLK
jgi:hypothetical protein